MPYAPRHSCCMLRGEHTTCSEASMQHAQLYSYKSPGINKRVITFTGSIKKGSHYHENIESTRFTSSVIFIPIQRDQPGKGCQHDKSYFIQYMERFWEGRGTAGSFHRMDERPAAGYRCFGGTCRHQRKRSCSTCRLLWASVCSHRKRGRISGRAYFPPADQGGKETGRGFLAWYVACTNVRTGYYRDTPQPVWMEIPPEGSGSHHTLYPWKQVGVVYGHGRFQCLFSFRCWWGWNAHPTEAEYAGLGQKPPRIW